MTESFRTLKVEKELRDIVSSYLIRHFTGAMLTVTQVRVTKDLRGAKIYLSQLGEQEITKEDLAEVQAHAVQMQSEISKKLRMRYCPRLKFEKDQGVSAAQRVDELLHKIKSE